MMKLMFLLLLFVSQHASGVEVEVGVESVLLPCQVPVNFSSNSVAVWVREELSNPTIHVRLESGDELSQQNDRYTKRTSMFTDALQTGNLGLTLRNPTVSDSGTYTCITRRFGDDQSQTEVQLKVSEPPPPVQVWPIGVAVLITVLLLLTILYCYLRRAYNIVKNRAVYMLLPEVVTEGAKDVKLPWRRDGDLPAAIRVKWTRVQPTHESICEYVKNQTGQWELKPRPGYNGRVQMEPDPVTNRDFTLTLKNPLCEDGGLYLCGVLDQDGQLITLTIVTLWVKETWWKTFKGSFLCGKNTTFPTNERRRRLSEMLEMSDGKWTLSAAVSEVLLNTDGRDNVGETRPLKGQSV